MKKILAFLLFVTALFTTNLYAVEIEGININVFGNMFIQGGKAKLGSGTINSNDGLYAGGVEISKGFFNGSEVGLTIQGGNGSPQIGENSATLDTSGNVIMSDIWYSQPLIEDVLRVKVGRVSLIESTGGDNEVTGNSDTQFIVPLFSDTQSGWVPYVEDNGNPWGFGIVYNPSEAIEIRYGYVGPIGNKGDSLVTENIYNEIQDSTITVYSSIQTGKSYHIDADGYNGIEINFKLIEDGNYRIKYWQLNEVLIENQPSPTGFALSFDQKLTPILTAGLRYGQVLNKKAIPDNSESGRFIVSNYSLALQVNGQAWDRVDDCLAAAVGREIYNDPERDSWGSFYEIYYRYTLNDYIAISPSFQYQTYTNVETISGQTVYALRLHIEF
ncbi:MAG: carbohydrate porin [Elusimicrobiota bacterium]|jgi:hypothetical protein|nr:carbohydrate porin [Elusimicrobiota bacterium]